MSTDPDTTALKAAFSRGWDEPFLTVATTGDSMTRGEVFNTASAMCDALRAQGLVEGDAVCLLLDNSLELLVAYFGAMLAGVRVIPIDPLKGTETISEVVVAAAPQLVVANYDIAVPARAVTGECLRAAFDAAKSGPPSAVDSLDRVRAQDVFLTAFTSGSTGRPKGVMHSTGNLVRSAIAMRDRMGFDASSVFLHNLPMTHMAGILNLIMVPLVSGSQLVVGERFSVGALPRFWEAPEAYDVNTFWFVPAMLSMLLKLDRGTFGEMYSARVPIVGCTCTAPLPPDLARAFEKRYCIPLYETYGLSETLFVAANGPGLPRIPGCAGPLLPHVKATIASDSEIHIQTPWNLIGYSTGEPGDSEQPFPSGDLGTLDAKGYLTIEGRKKDIIIRGGMNLSPTRIEEVLRTTDAIDEAVALGFQDELIGERVVAFVVPAESARDADVKRANAEVIARLGRDWSVDEFVILTEIPLNANGKADKLAIRATYLSERA